MQFNTACKDYDSINQHSHQSTRTTGPQGGRGANHDHARGGGGGATLELLYVYIYIILKTGRLRQPVGIEGVPNHAKCDVTHVFSALRRAFH